ncbi:adenosylmethionine decarboxylase [Rossellomorea sp. BNER]|uniref:adenosylmethionine decarboxylase n=1 Tax=Rossellomorea sp. BNER TaxID=2962031 RepID=UPI003AF22B3C|nr:adenosylmethionine decarboxylase [Rossellomorea sp. BNER]
METSGHHIIIDAYGCQSIILNDAKQLKKLLIESIESLGMEILSKHFHSFSPQGVTGVIGISTSHFSIHTWPEHGYAALDLYTCGDQDIDLILKKILHKLKAGHVEIYELFRGEESIHKPLMKKLNFKDYKTDESSELFQLQDDRGNEWDMKQLREIIAGNHDVLYHASSPFQDILLVKANDLRLYLDQELQFCSLDEKYYHEALVYPVMELSATHDRILILGGGDGLALREVLKYPNVKHVDLVDIDPMMIQMSKSEPALLEQNNQSFLDKRVNVHTEDAKKYLEKDLQKYNVIIIDFPDPVNPVISSLYTKEVFKQVANILSKDGVIVCQSNSPEDTPQSFWSIAKTMETVGLHTLAYNVTVPSFGLWGYHLAAHKEISNQIPEISVSHQALTKDMGNLFEIPDYVMSEKENAIVNSVDNLKLHEISKVTEL